MKKNIVVLSSVVLLLLIPGIALSDVFAEKLIASLDGDSPAQFSVIDKTTGMEIQILSGDADGRLSGIDFAPDGRLFGAASESFKSPANPGIYEVQLTIEKDSRPTGELIGHNTLGGWCDDISFDADSRLYCTQTILTPGEHTDLVIIDLESEPVISRDTIFTGYSGGNGLAISPDGTIYFGNYHGLYEVDPDTKLAGLIAEWTPDEDIELYDCLMTAMDFDSSGILHGTCNVEDGEFFFLVTIDLETAEFTSANQYTRNPDLPLADFDYYPVDPITFSPYDLDFLVGTSYGTVISGFDLINAQNVDGFGLVISMDEPTEPGNAEVSVCSNTKLSIDSIDEVATACYNTTINVLSGEVPAEFTPNDEDTGIITSTLSAGNVAIFDAEECTITNDGSGPFPVSFDGGESIPVPEGEIFECTKPVDHYLGYDTKVKNSHGHDDDYGDDKHNKIQVTLVDDFADEAKYDVKKLKRLFNPVDKNDEGISNELSHLVEYDIKESKGESKFNGIKNILVTNQFGALTVDIKKAKTLLVPSFKDHYDYPDEPEDLDINHFKCYDAKESKNTPKFEKRPVNLVDQFLVDQVEESLTMEVYKPKLLCSPVEKIHDGDPYPRVNDENYVMCYDLKEIKGQPKFQKINVFTNNQFGPEELEAKKPKQLCVPSTIVPSEPSEPIIITGTYDGNLEVESDQVVIIDGATINGNVKNDGGDVFMINGCEINGNVKSNNDGTISIDSCTVNGNVQTQTGSLTILNDSEVTGNVNAKEADFVTITDNDESFGGHLRVENAGTVEITNNNVAENLRVKTSGDVTLSDNTVGGHLRSFDNVSTTVTGNIVTGNLNTGGTDTVTTTGNTVEGNIRAADSTSVDITDNISGENLRIKDSSNVTIDQNEVGANLRVLANDQVSVTENHADGKINIKDNVDCSHSANTADGKIKIKDCTEV